MIIHHQEVYDGSGSPFGPGGAKIPLGALIIAIAGTLSVRLPDRLFRPGAI